MRIVLTIIFSWAAIYTSVTLTLMAFQWFGLNLALPLQTFLLTIVLVPMMVLFIGPKSIAAAKWLCARSPKPSDPGQTRQ